MRYTLSRYFIHSFIHSHWEWVSVCLSVSPVQRIGRWLSQSQSHSVSQSVGKRLCLRVAHTLRVPAPQHAQCSEYIELGAAARLLLDTCCLLLGAQLSLCCVNALLWPTDIRQSTAQLSSALRQRRLVSTTNKKKKLKQQKKYSSKSCKVHFFLRDKVLFLSLSLSECVSVCVCLCVQFVFSNLRPNSMAIYFV